MSMTIKDKKTEYRPNAGFTEFTTMELIPLLHKPQSPFEPPSLAYSLLTSPIHLALSYLHKVLVALRGAPYTLPESPIRVVCISDSHTYTVALPPGDLLVHAGDLANKGTVSEIQAQIDWLSCQSYQHIVFIAGNHDSYFDPRSRVASDRSRTLDYKNVRYLQHADAMLEFPNCGGRKLKLYGAPQIPACGGDEMAFQYQREEDAWTGTVPENLDILITHTPPRWHLDNGGVGCDFLRNEVRRVRPKVHIFGHVHAGRGQETVFWGKAQEAYERTCARQTFWSWLGPRPVLDLLRVPIYDVIGIVWSRIWGAETDATAMINAGLVNFETKLAHGPQVIDI
jgi:predicted phosphohydrolase